MCLGVPGRVVEWIDRDPVFARASIEFGGVRRTCHMACVPEAQIGDYVVIHAGLAISRIDAAEAERVLDELNWLGLDEEIPPDQQSARPDHSPEAAQDSTDTQHGGPVP